MVPLYKKMGHRCGVLITVMMICASSGQTKDPLIEDFINSLRTTTLKPRSCGVSKECVPFYRCRAVDADDSICGYPDTCCKVSDKTTQPITPFEGLPQHERCGYRNFRSNATGNAENGTDFSEYPWYVSLMTAKEADPENYFCSGVIIAPTAVLTNADCAEAASEEFFVLPGKWVGIEGKYIQYRARRVHKVITHDDYDASSFSNNIALLIVESPFQWEEKVRPVCLPESNTKFDEARCYFINWTNGKPGGSGALPILKKIAAPIVPPDQCLAKRREYVGVTVQTHHTDLCAGGKDGKDYDVFSNGTPLVCPVHGGEDRYFLAGIESHYPQREDVSNRRYVPPKVPRVYISIRLLLQWLNNTLTQNGINLSY